MSVFLLGAASNPATEIATTFGFNAPVFFMHLVGFAVVAFLLQKFAYKPIIQMLDERKSRIAESMANAEQTKAELANAQVKAQEIANQAAAQATKLIEEARAGASRLAEQERQKAVADAQAIVAKAREAGEAELNRLKSELRKEFGRLVVQTASRSTGDILTGDQKTRLADSAVRELAA